LEDLAAPDGPARGNALVSDQLSANRISQPGWAVHQPPLVDFSRASHLGPF
jgi:hypothetical protein